MPALFKTYNRFDLSVAEAEGTKVVDTNGNTYLDFGAGIGVNNLGHRHPTVQQAVKDQLDKYWHVSNLYHVPIQEDVAKKLAENSAGDYVFFCNSGAEANEAAIKLARKATGKTKIITCKQSFHGRTFATMSATGQEKIQTGFGPMLESFEYVPFNDIDAVKNAIDNNTAAIMLEVIQGEGGVIVGDASFIKDVEQLCNDNDVLLIIDEIQTGIGRTAKPFGYQHYGISPDVITVAKGLGNGLPVGAMIAKAKYYDVLGPGSHGTTFGGNPLAMAAARAVLDIVFQDEFIEEIEEKASYLHEQLQLKLSQLPFVAEIRGKGLMIGIECKDDVSTIVSSLLHKGLLVLNAGPNVIRLLPPLVITKKEIDFAIDLIYESIQEKISIESSEPIVTNPQANNSVAEKLKGKDFLTLGDFSKEELMYLIQFAIHLKEQQKQGIPHRLLEGKTLAMIFEKSSTRTRVSFETGMYQLGGHALFLNKDDIQIGNGETISDTAKVLSRFVDGMMIRTFGHEIVEELAENADIPVINGLTDDFHPCQVLADLLTIYEIKGSFKGLKLAFVGDGNNVAHSLLMGCAIMGIDCSIGSPKGYEVNDEILKKVNQIAQESGAVIVQTNEPKEAVENADFIYTDVWTSMGFEAEAEERLGRFTGFQVNEELVKYAKADYSFMHCLPAKRGEEVSEAIIDGPHSVVFDEAENRLHAQKAILATII